MNWRKALAIEDNSWLGIGKYIGELTKKAIEKINKTTTDLTNHLRSAGNEHIRLSYVEEYLSGNASFGCFFPQLRYFLEILPEDIFKGVRVEQAKQYIKSLDDYLTDPRNMESLVIFLKYQPGQELRDFVRTYLSKKRDESIKKPFYSMEVGEDSKEREKDVFELIKKYITGSSGRELRCLPENIELVSKVDLVKTQIGELYNRIMEKKPQPENPEFMQPEDIAFCNMFEGASILVQPTLKRGKIGFTVDFLSVGDLFDNGVAAHANVSVEAWREAYRQGTFTKIDTTDRHGVKTLATQKIEYMCNCVDSGLFSLVPIREPSEAERYEAHQRWVKYGGASMPGPGGPNLSTVKKTSDNIPNPRSKFGEVEYRIESTYGGIVIPLSKLLPELVLDRPLLKE